MRVLITGASGRLGRYVAQALEKHYDILLSSRHRPPEELAHLPWKQADLTCFEDCQTITQGIDVIQHIGAVSKPTDHPAHRPIFSSRGVPFDATFKTNMIGTYYLMQAAVEAHVKTVVMAGSCCALGYGFRISSTPFPFQSLPMNEKHPCYPEDSYSFSKYAGESLLASYTRAHGIRTYITRIGSVCTEKQRQQIAANAQPSEAWSPWLWSWVGSEDVAQAHRLLMEAASVLPEHDVYFVNANDTSALEPSRELVERFNPELLPRVNRLEGHQALISCDKIKTHVGWQPVTSWRQYM